MPDLLHPNAKGYAIWIEAMESKLAELLGANDLVRFVGLVG